MAGGAVAWGSKLQAIVAMSTCEAECSSAAAAAKQGLWARTLLSELHGQLQASPMDTFCDNQSAIWLVKEPLAGAGRKHIDTTYQFVRNRSMRGEMQLMFVASNEQVADIVTKASGNWWQYVREHESTFNW